MFKKLAKSSLFAAAATIAVLPMLGAVPAVAQDGENIDVTIGWVPPDITGVFKTATNFFELAAEDANKNGFNVKVLTKSPTSPTAFAEQVSIIEDMIQRKVDLIAVSPAEVATVKPALARATAAGIPVVVVNLLEPIDGVDVSSYIGFDNTQGAEVSAYSVVDYFGGPGVLGTGDKVDVEPGTYLDLKFWEDIASKLSAEDKAKIKARGAIIEGVAGGLLLDGPPRGIPQGARAVPGYRDRGRHLRRRLEPREGHALRRGYPAGQSGQSRFHLGGVERDGPRSDAGGRLAEPARNHAGRRGCR